MIALNTYIKTAKYFPLSIESFDSILFATFYSTYNNTNNNLFFMYNYMSFDAKIYPKYKSHLNILFLCAYSRSFYNFWEFIKITWAAQDFCLSVVSHSIWSYSLNFLFKNTITSFVTGERFIEIVVKNIKKFKEMLFFFKHSSLLRCTMLCDLWGREFFYETKKLILMYNLISEVTNTRFFFRVILDEAFVMVTCSDLYASAAWCERECWDMLGLVFLGHLDLRRILTDYGFLGHPLRKEFPLTGFLEVRYNDLLKRVVFEPVEFSQELRFFDFSNPWNFTLISNHTDSFLKHKNVRGGDIGSIGTLSDQLFLGSVPSNFKATDLWLLSNVFAFSGKLNESIRMFKGVSEDIFSFLSYKNNFQNINISGNLLLQNFLSSLSNDTSFFTLSVDTILVKNKFFSFFIYYMLFFSLFVNKKRIFVELLPFYSILNLDTLFLPRVMLQRKLFSNLLLNLYSAVPAMYKFLFLTSYSDFLSSNILFILVSKTKTLKGNFSFGFAFFN